ncbi:serine/threonine-protein kinase [Saccharothrix syringae]|uniref:non-specific serine/threonine protein kinase n=1 Tax=Saccharothrix syringae TaxID=103733 RepID=A0A5Q0HAX3_SACSY|nr:serine/threonine-protein kinase [Saccharothrix syringae]QFZ23398.1 serine/threonine protein kinase [Saccharothrix syringae]
MSNDGRVIAERYRFLDRIGSGAMGVVWRAQDERLGRIVAIKQLLLQPSLDEREQDEAIQRAMREGRIAAKLHHPNAIAVYDVVEENGAPCLVMEYLPSYSLADTMAEHGPLEPVEVARIGAQAAAALAAAHAAGIVHRDVKPGNVLLADNGLVKITDFGISRASDDVTVTKTGLIAGTPAYLAPEIARGQDPTPASDVFSLGSTLYAAVEGEPPFGLSENTLGVLHAVAAGRINPPTVDHPLTDVLLRFLNYDPADRPTMAQARDLLNAVAQGRHPSLTGLPAATATAIAPVGGAGATTVVDPDRTRVVRPGPRTVGPRTGAVPPVGPAPGRSNTRPLAITAAVLGAIVLLGVLLIALDVFGSNNPSTPPAGGSSSTQPPATTTSSTTSQVTTTVQTETVTVEVTTTDAPEPEPTTTTAPRPTTTTPRPTTTTAQPTTAQPTTSVSVPTPSTTQEQQ